MAFRDLQAGIGFALVGLQVRVDQFDETVEVLDRDGFVALIEIVHVSVEDLDEEFNGYGSVHASVGDAESALETFKNALAIAVELYRLVQFGFSLVSSIAKKEWRSDLRSWDLPLSGRPQPATIGGLPDIPPGIDRAS